ncbi:hypothetical protein ACHAQJ_006694 [Trichoderma viride]
MVAISVSTADIEFAKQIGKMLEQLSCIDDCDTLGQKTDELNIHKATREIIYDVQKIVYDQQIRKWLNGDGATRQIQHHDTLQNLRADEACQFLLKDDRSINWCQASDNELDRRSQHQLPQPKIGYHYCQKDKNSKPTYNFPSLILSLLEQFEGPNKPFVEWYKQAVASRKEPAVSFNLLKHCLRYTLEQFDRPLFLVIDGLDECEIESRGSLLESLTTLSQTTPRFKVLLSSRPEEVNRATRASLNKESRPLKYIMWLSAFCLTASMG